MADLPWSVRIGLYRVQLYIHLYHTNCGIFLAKHCVEKMLIADPAHRYSAREILDHPWITVSCLVCRKINAHFEVK